MDLLKTYRRPDDTGADTTGALPKELPQAEKGKHGYLDYSHLLQDLQPIALVKRYSEV